MNVATGRIGPGGPPRHTAAPGQSRVSTPFLGRSVTGPGEVREEDGWSCGPTVSSNLIGTLLYSPKTQWMVRSSRLWIHVVPTEDIHSDTSNEPNP